MSWVEKNRKIDNRGGGGRLFGTREYTGLFTLTSDLFLEIIFKGTEQCGFCVMWFYPNSILFFIFKSIKSVSNSPYKCLIFSIFIFVWSFAYYYHMIKIVFYCMDNLTLSGEI